MTDLKATERRSHLLSAVSHGGAYTVKNLTSTREVTASSIVGTTVNFGRIPSNARLLGSSRFYADIVGASSFFDIGIRAVNGNLANADDPDALSNGHDLSGALNDSLAITLIADYGLPAWDFVASETSDPGGELEVYGSITDATTTGTAKTVTLEMNYIVD
jgi:hypothetical protein